MMPMKDSLDELLKSEKITQKDYDYYLEGTIFHED
jgi:hypothetical protein